jgi:zinc protease
MDSANPMKTRATGERWMLAGIALAAAALLGFAVAAESATHPDELEIPPLGEIQIPEYERIELGNGLVVYLLEERAFPMVEIRTLTRGGSAYDPAGEVGLADVMAQVMRTGGSERFPGDELDLAVESVGTELSMSAGEQLFTGRLSTLSDQLDDGLAILADVLRNPVFPEEKIAEVKQQEKTAIASRNDESIGILTREFAKLLFGADSPYGWHTEYATIAAIDADDLRAAHARFFHPDLTTIVAWGDFSTKEMRAALERHLGDWTRSGATLEAPPGVPEPRPAGLYYAEKTDVTQSTVAVGCIGIQQSDPIYPAAMVMQEILGGGFASRLFSEIRTRRGLAYATGTAVNAPLHRKGLTIGYVLTQADSTVTSLELLIAEIERMREEPITPEELARGKDAILNSFVFQFDSPGEVVLRNARYELFGYDADFLTRYQDAVTNVTADEVMAAAQAMFEPETWQILVVGNDDEFARPLSDVMPVQELDISIPKPEVAAAPIPDATPESLARGQEMVAAMIEAAGGADALDAVEAYTVTGSGTVSAQGMELQIGVVESYVFPDKRYTEQTVFGQKMIQVVDGTSGWMKGPQGIQDLPEEQAREALEDELTGGGLHFLRRAPELEIQALAPETIDGTAYDVLFVRSLGDKNVKLYVDPETHLVARSHHDGQHPMTQAPAAIQTTYGDYREVGGVLFPYETSMTVDGEPFMAFTVEEVTVNAEVDASVFTKPEGSGS